MKGKPTYNFQIPTGAAGANMDQPYYYGPTGPQINAAYTAGVSVMNNRGPNMDMNQYGQHLQKVAEQEEHAEGIDTENLVSTHNAAQMLEGGVPVPFVKGNVVSNVAGAAVGFYAADSRAKRETEALVDQYRDEISQELGIPEEEVDYGSLLVAAEKNTGLKRALGSIEGKKQTHPWVNICGLVGSLPAIPIFMSSALTGPIGILLGLAVGYVGYEVGRAVGRKVMPKGNHQNPQHFVRQIAQKIMDGKQVEATDVFAVRVLQNPEIESEIRSQYGKHFNKLSKDQQGHVLHKYKQLANACALEAKMINSGEQDIDRLMFDGPPMYESPIVEYNNLRAAAGEMPMGPMQQAPDPELMFAGGRRGGGQPAGPNGGFRNMIRQQRMMAANNMQNIG